MHFPSMLQTGKSYQNLLKTECWELDAKIENFLQDRNAKHVPILEGAVPDVMARSREGFDLKWLQYRSTL